METFKHELMHFQLANELKAELEQHRLSQELQADTHLPYKAFVAQVGGQLKQARKQLQNYSDRA